MAGKSTVVKADTFYCFRQGPELLLLTSEEYFRAKRRGAIRQKARRDALKRGLRWYRQELQARQGREFDSRISQKLDCIQGLLDE